MSTGYGQLAKFGIHVTTTWHTAVALAAGDLVKVEESPEFSSGQEDVQDTSMYGVVFPRYVDKGQKMVDLEFSGKLRYENAHWMHIIQLIGADAVTGTSAPYTHTITMANEPMTFYSAAMLIDDMVYEWPAVKPSSFEITTGDDGIMYFTCAGIADHVAYAGDATNDSTTIGTTATFDTEAKLVLIGHCQIKLNDQEGTTLGTGDLITDKCKVAIRMSRPYDRQFLAGGTGTTNEWKTSQPMQNGLLSDILLTLDFAELEAIDYVRDHADEDMKKAEILFQSDGTHYLKFEFPNLRPLKPSAKISGPGRIPYTIVYQCLGCATAPTGMTGITTPFKMTLANTHEEGYDDGV
jgi:hypothetical protein